MKNLTEAQQKTFTQFYELLTFYNAQFNLTAITEKNEVYDKHFADSLTALPFLKQNATLVDVGAGAGFPSIPLAIVRPDLTVTMLDSLQKRVNFLNTAAGELKLTNTKAIHQRAEDFAKSARETFTYAIARAVAKLNTLLEYCAPLVEIGGEVIAYKGSTYKTELNEAHVAAEKLGLKLKTVHTYTLPGADYTLALIIYTKTKPTPIKYPRGQNKPKNNPL